MAAPDTYDASLTVEIRRALEGLAEATDEERSRLAELIGRVEERIRSLRPAADRLERTLAFLRGPPFPGASNVGPSEPRPDPVRRTLAEMAELSGRLDAGTEPTTGFFAAEGVARRAHELAHAVSGALEALDPTDLLADGFHRVMGFLSRLLRNAVARIRAFARALGIASFSVALSSLPPEVTVTFTFGMGDSERRTPDRP